MYDSFVFFIRLIYYGIIIGTAFGILFGIFYIIKQILLIVKSEIENK